MFGCYLKNRYQRALSGSFGIGIGVFAANFLALSAGEQLALFSCWRRLSLDFPPRYQLLPSLQIPLRFLRDIGIMAQNEYFIYAGR